MKKSFFLTAAMVGCLSLSACDNYTAEPYGVSAPNVEVLKRVAPANVTVGAFSGPSDQSMMCRLVGPIHLPGDVAPQDYISNALASDLEISGLSGSNGPAVTLTGKLEKFSFNSMIGFGNWDLAVTLTSSNGHSVSVENNYGFSASYAGDAACHNVADAFEPAVQALIQKVVSNPDFPALLKN
jgi:hypothetical protein